MESNRGTRARLLALVVAAGALAMSSGEARAATLGSAPLRLASLESYSCSVVNLSGKDVAVEVRISIAGGGNGAAQTCSPLIPTGVCVAQNEAGSAGYRYCTITTSSKRSVRGTFCNTSTGICVPVE